MSRNSAPSNVVEDIWTKLQRQKATPSTTNNESENDNVNKIINTQVVFFGDLNSGKSTLIQSFLKPSGVKETKPTVALEYNYARKTVNNLKYIAHLYEIGGNLMEPKFLEIPINKTTLGSSIAVICCDLSRPQTSIVSLLRSLSGLREVLQKTTAILQSNDIKALTELQERNNVGLKGHVDERRLRPLEVPTLILGTKADSLRALPLNERRFLIQCLRFIAHYFGCHLLTITTSSSSASSTAGGSNSSDVTVSRENFRSLVSMLAFPSSSSSSGGAGGGAATVRPAYELGEFAAATAPTTSDSRMVYITKGQDSFENILLGMLSSSTAESGNTDKGSNNNNNNNNNAKYRLVSAASELELYLTTKGVTRDCWHRITNQMAEVFGEADALPSLSLHDKNAAAADGEQDQEEEEEELDTGGGPGDAAEGAALGQAGQHRYKVSHNPYPESEIDDMRQVREQAILRYRQEQDRKNEMIAKLNKA